MYVARDSSGKPVQGHQEAPSETAAVSILQSKGLYVTQVLNTATVVKSVKKRKRLRKRLTAEDQLFFIAQCSNLLGVGIPFVRAMDVISELTESDKMHEVIIEITSNIKSGSTFKDAIARHPKIFPAHWTFLIEAGELSGTLPQVLGQLAQNMEATENLKKKVVSALVYPSVLVSASLAAIIFFMVFIVPIFTKLFKGFKAKLPLVTQIIVNISDFMKSNFLFAVIGGVIAVVFLRRYFASPKGRRVLHIALLRVPIIGSAMSDIIHARMCIILSMLIRSGLNFLKSIEVTSNVSGNFVFETALNNIRLEVQSGKPLSACLGENAIFSPMMVNLVKIGEESGKLPEMVEKASQYFTQRVDIFATRIGVLIEPIVMIVVGGIIGTIAVAIFMPIIRLSSVVN